jgi:hypothetical protein
MDMAIGSRGAYEGMMRKRMSLKGTELMPHRSSERACFYGREDAIKNNQNKNTVLFVMCSANLLNLPTTLLHLVMLGFEPRSLVFQTNIFHNLPHSLY